MSTIKQHDNIAYSLYLNISQGILNSSLAMFFNVVVIIIAFYEISSSIFLFSWLFCVTLILSLRSLDMYLYFKNEDISTLYVHIKRFKLLSILLVLSVSSGIIILTPSNLPFHQAFLAMIVAGLSAGAVMALSYCQNLVRLYLVILILPFASLMLIQGSTIHILIFFLMLLFLLMLILFSKRFNKSMIELIEAKNRANIQAHYDITTGLANRLTLYDRLSTELKRIKRHHTSAAVLFIDLDDFKIINDTYGHQFGDTVLQKFATLISPIVREEDTFARLGGDEFVILISNIKGDKQESIRIAKQIADKIQNAIASPIKIDDDSITLSASIGIDIADKNTHDSEHILNNADSAMYKSKQSGKNQTTLFE